MMGRNWRVFLSFAVVLHLLAVAAEPLRFFSASPVKFASEDARLLRMVTQRYSDFMYLSHGYSFFAPNPGPSHLLECEIAPNSNVDLAAEPPLDRPAFANSSRELSKKSSWRVFPDRRQDRPRLLYHRFFMLSEFYHTHFAPATLAEQSKLDTAIVEQWKQDRRMYEQLQKSILANLEGKHLNHEISLRRVEHALPSEYQIFVDRWKMTDPRLYLVLPEGDASASPERLLPP
ncbi:MAG: hypothetical protein SGI77_06335 [Pirellulaceae bacterium]|nr:hypothetical protein [Pirellulaceae bacterium]